MAGNGKEITLKLLQRERDLTNDQLDTKVEESDLPELAAYFDNTEDYVEKLQLSPGQQTDVRTQALLSGTHAGMKVALKYWRSRNPVEATFRTLLLILLSLLKGDIAAQVSKYLSDKCSSVCPPPQESQRVLVCPPPQESQTVLNPTLSSYRSYIQSRYRTLVSMSTTVWPHVPISKVFKLAMIQRESIQRGKIDDSFIRLSITGKVDDILRYKTQVKFENIFNHCQSNTEGNVILIEGAPGSGKSTLALHICQQWAENKLFQEYEVVVLVRLRDPLIREAKSIEDLLPCRNSTMAKEVGDLMRATDGKGVLWVLDGWDELPSDLPTDSIINKLIRRDLSHESPLHLSAILITSRPSLSSMLHPLVSTRIEVLGFTPKELEEYFSECLKGDSTAIQTLLERIRENPVVEGSCYLPLNAAIVAHVFMSDGHSLPTSNHKIFSSVVQSSLKRYLQDRLGKTISIGEITSPDSLPSEIQAPFSNLCRLAFYGIQRNKVTVNESDLTDLSISKDISELGLLQSVPSIVSDGLQVYMCFLHLSIQELLAAIHISHMLPQRQFSVFQDLFGTPRFNAVFQFYSGITKLKTYRRWLSMLPRFLCPVPSSMFDLVREVIKKEASKSLGDSKPLLVSLLHCLYEAEDSSLCVFVSTLFNHSLCLTGTTLSPLDCLSVGYFLSLVCTSVSGGLRVCLSLDSCCIGDQGCKFLVRGLCKCLNNKITSPLVMDLGDNDIHEEGIHHLAQLLKNTSVIRKLDLSSNIISNRGLESLCDALSSNTTLEGLKLRNSINILNEVNGPFLRLLLSKNASLSYLSLQGIKITHLCCHHIADGLSSNKTLKTLDLYNCHLTDESVKELSTGLSNYIEELNIGENHSLTMNGLKILARRLITLPRLRRLWIPVLLESSIKTEFSEVNKERRRNGLPEILVKDLYGIIPYTSF